MNEWAIKKLATLFYIMAFLLLSSSALAGDWKYFGGSSFPKNEKVLLVFYDIDSIEFIPGRNVRVWTKALTQSQILRTMKKRKKKIIDETVDKVLKGYFPPYMSVFPTTPKDIYLEIVEWELAANYSEVNPRLKIFYEINCREKQIRELQTILFNNDGSIDTSNNGEWDYISPESNAETLYKLLCK